MRARYYLKLIINRSRLEPNVRTAAVYNRANATARYAYTDWARDGGGAHVPRRNVRAAAAATRSRRRALPRRPRPHRLRARTAPAAVSANWQIPPPPPPQVSDAHSQIYRRLEYATTRRIYASGFRTARTRCTGWQTNVSNAANNSTGSNDDGDGVHGPWRTGAAIR